jgi:hypothetical protein
MQIRLRVPLRFFNRQHVLLLGDKAPVVLRVPARTTLDVIEIWEETALCFTPDGTRITVSRQTIREHGYLPRSIRPHRVPLSAHGLGEDHPES